MSTQSELAKSSEYTEKHVDALIILDGLLEKFRLRRTNVGLRLGTPAPSVIAR